MNAEIPKSTRQEIIPKKTLERGGVCNIDQWIEFCERNIESGASRIGVEEYEIKPKIAAAEEGYSYVLRLPRENDTGLKKLDLLWFTRPQYFELIDTIAARHNIMCKHTDDEYYAFISRDDAEKLSELLAEAQRNSFSEFEAIEGEIIENPKALPKN